MADSGVIETKAQFKNSPEGLYERWDTELFGAEEDIKTWHEQADAANRRYRGEPSSNLSEVKRGSLSLFHANVNLLRSILYGQVPKVDVSRRFQDPNDEEARVASEALERHLNTDIEDSYDDFQNEVKDAIFDWKVAGLGQTRLDYDADFRKVEAVPARADDTGREIAPAIPEHDEKGLENVRADYVYWKHFRWSPCRRWKDCRWVAFMVEITRDQAKEKFGEEISTKLPMVQKHLRDGDTREQLKEVWSRIQVWEVWSKEDKKIYDFVKGAGRIARVREDSLGLKGFFPCPRPLAANLTTGKFLPKPDLEIDKALYDEIDELANRLRYLVKMCKVSGAYDKAFPELARVIEEAGEGQMVAVGNWAALAEKGGLGKCMDFVPIEPLVKAIEVLTSKLVEKIQLLYQVTGINDVMRGQATKSKTATEVRAETGFASSRLQTDQDEVARFASDLQCLKAEIISKHFSPQTIIERSNMLQVEVDPITKQPDMPLIQKAVELIKSKIWEYRIEVKPDSIALRDYAAMKSERVEAVGSLAGLFQQAVPMVQIFPQSAPFLLEIGKWLIAATKGSQQMEAIFDKLVAAAEQAAMNPPPPKPDPQVEKAKLDMQAQQQQMQVDQQKAGLEMQGKVMDLQLKREEIGMKRQGMALDAQAKQQDMAMNQQAQMQDHAMAAQERQEEHAMNREQRQEEHAMHAEKMKMGMDAEKASMQHKMAMMKARPKGKPNAK